ncbi:endonuclease V-like isoform X1 [Denticeps clupeoides]|uniref:Endonuclease V n=1 Tax=Denticeps clupeoides TaxID=299321 RepID=A0AAY4AG48_9TELE|nr:endonuclease V isoform X1 [Denticeps clupeoides]
MALPPEQDLITQWEREQSSLKELLQDGDTESWQTRADFTGLERVGGVDLSFIKGDDANACAQLVVLSFPELKVLYEDSQLVTLSAPYVAGFLAFRETPSLLEALKKLERTQPALMPQVVFVDGNGLFHYREFGLACHLGVLSGLPCIGVAKNLLQVQGVAKDKEHASQIQALQKGGDTFPLIAESGRVLGKALRSSDSSSKPVYVSVGHRISLDTAVRLTHACCRHRVPEPIRQKKQRGIFDDAGCHGCHQVALLIYRSLPLWNLLPSPQRFLHCCSRSSSCAHETPEAPWTSRRRGRHALQRVPAQTLSLHKLQKGGGQA